MDRMINNSSIGDIFSDNIPKVGIFWYYKNNLIVNCQRTDMVKNIDGFLDLPTSHYDYWNNVCSEIPELRIYEYEEIPRGRVVMKSEASQYIVYSSKSLAKDKDFRIKIIKKFSLPPNNTSFVSDLHYEDPNKIGWDD